MTTIKQVFGVREAKGDIGLEIEIEGRGLPTSVGDDETWRVERDGSLKNGLEYVIRTPTSLEGIDMALDELSRQLKAGRSKVENSYRAGVHLHINVQPLTPKQLFNFICAYIIVEELLLDWCEPSRRGNHFCFRASDAEYFIHILTQIVKTGDIRRLITDEIRYSGVNICSLPKYGSLEFRALESTQDFNKILTWAKVLKHIQTVSQEYEDPRQMLNTLSAAGAENFVRKVLGPYAPQFLVGKWLERVRTGIILAQDVAYAREWGRQSFNIFKKEENIFL